MAKSLGIDISIGQFARLPLDPTEYDMLIATEGVPVTVRRAVPCPCVRIESMRARIRCPLCNGLQWVYPQDLELEIMALVLNRSPKRTLMAHGEIVTGTVTCTFSREYIPGRGDIVLPHSEYHVVTESLIHLENQARMQHLRRDELDRALPGEAIPKLSKPMDKLLYSDPVAIDYVAFLHNDKLFIAEEGIHWTLKDGHIKWMPTTPIRPGDAFSIRYTAAAAYMINPGEPVARAGHDGTLPYRCQGMRLDRWSNTDLLDNRA